LARHENAAGTTGKFLIVAALPLDIAQMIYDARIQAGLTQEQLAKRVGTKQPVIARLEDADYEGHSLTMLQRIAKALNRTLHVEMSQAAAR